MVTIEKGQVQQVDQAIDHFSRLILEELEDTGGVSGVWVGGGAIRDYFSGKRKFNDVDLYFENTSQYEKTKKFFEKHAKKTIFSNDRVDKFLYKNTVFDLVKMFNGKPEQFLDHFDFTICTAALSRKNGFVHHETFFIDLASKRLVIHTLYNPLSTFSRLQKYIQKGYVICRGGMLRIAREIQTIDLDQPSENIIQYYDDGSPKFIGID